MPITNNNNPIQHYGKRPDRGERRSNQLGGAMQRMNNLVKNQNDMRIGHHTDQFDQTQQVSYQRYGRTARNAEDSALAVTANNKANETDTRLGKEEYDYLQTLKEKYGNVDFVVANFEDGEDTSRFATGDKEYTCVITPALLKKMAADEATAAKYEKVIEGAGADLTDMKEQIAALDTDESETDPVNLKEQVQNYGFSMDNSGKVSYFALLRDSLPAQNGEDDKGSYQYFEADSVESLIEQMQAAVEKMREKKEELAVTDGGEEAAESTAAAEPVLDITV
jgi:hypothetical protein